MTILLHIHIGVHVSIYIVVIIVIVIVVGIVDDDVEIDRKDSIDKGNEDGGLIHAPLKVFVMSISHYALAKKGFETRSHKSDLRYFERN